MKEPGHHLHFPTKSNYVANPDNYTLNKKQMKLYIRIVFFFIIGPEIKSEYQIVTCYASSGIWNNLRDRPQCWKGLSTPAMFTLALCIWKYRATVYPKKYAHGFVVLCFVVVMQSFIMNSHEVFIHIHQGCFAGTGAIVRYTVLVGIDITTMGFPRCFSLMPRFQWHQSIFFKLIVA